MTAGSRRLWLALLLRQVVVWAVLVIGWVVAGEDLRTGWLAILLGGALLNGAWCFVA